MLSDTEQAALRELLINHPWSVYVEPLGRVYPCPDRETALQRAKDAREASAHNRARGCRFELTPHVLCYGVPWPE